MKRTVTENIEEFETVYTKIDETEIDGVKAIRAVKADKIMQFDENTIVKLKDCDFHNGIIRVKMLSHRHCLSRQ